MAITLKCVFNCAQSMQSSVSIPPVPICKPIINAMSNFLIFSLFSSNSARILHLVLLAVSQLSLSISRYSLTTVFDCNLSIIIISPCGFVFSHLPSSCSFVPVLFFFWKSWNYRCNYNFWHMSIYSLLCTKFSTQCECHLISGNFFSNISFFSLLVVFFSVFLFWFVDFLGHHSHPCLLTTFSLNFFTVSFDPCSSNRSSTLWQQQQQKNWRTK